jgi:hypothetical protein
MFALGLHGRSPGAFLDTFIYFAVTAELRKAAGVRPRRVLLVFSAPAFPLGSKML